MIVEQDIQSQSDPFTFAGRIALAGGTAYAINKTIKENGNEFTSPFKTKTRTLHEKVGELIKNSGKKLQTFESRNSLYFKSNFFNTLTGTNDLKTRPGSLGDIKTHIDRLGGGYKNYSKDLYPEIERLVDKIKSTQGRDPSLEYVLNKSGISEIRINGGSNLKFVINPIQSDGTILTGANGRSRYAAKSLYRNIGGDTLERYGADVGLTRTITNSFDKILSREISVSDIYNDYDQAQTYSDRIVGNLDAEIGSKANPQVQSFIKESAIEDPGLHRYGGAMSSEAKKKFMKRQAIAGNAISSASDYAKGILLGEDNPIRSFPFLEETANPKQIFRNIQHIDKNGKSSYMANKKTVFLNEEEMELFKNELAKRGTKIGELAKEQLIASNKSGRIIDRTRGLNISASSVTDHSEFLMNRIQQITGLSPNDLSSKLASGGIDKLPLDQQSRIRNLSLSDYGNTLRQQRDLAIKQRQNIDFKLESGRLSKEDAQLLKDREDKLIEELNKKLQNKNVFGKKMSGMEDVVLDSSHKGLFIDNISYNNGEVNFALRRDKMLGAGDKIHDTSGEVKAIIKDSVPEIEEALVQAWKTKNPAADEKQFRRAIAGVDFVANRSVLKDELTSRNAFATYYAAVKKAQRTGDTGVLQTLTDFAKSYESMNPEDRTSIFHKLPGSATGYGLSETGFGAVKEHLVAFGNAAADMGAGKRGSISDRQLLTLKSMGMDNFVEDIFGRADNVNASKASIELRQLEQLALDNTHKGIPVQNVPLEKLFPRKKLDVEESLEEVLEQRKTVLESLSKTSSHIDLGKEIAGVRKIPVLTGEHYKGFAGLQIGSFNPTNRKYTHLDESIRSIIREMQNPSKDHEKRIETLVRNYKTAMEKVKGTLNKDVTRAKVNQSMYSMVDSAPNGLKAYSEALNESLGVKSALPNVAVINDDDFIRLHGEDTYKGFMKQLKEHGPLDGSVPLNKSKLPISSAYGMATRFPDEGINSMAMNVLPASAFNSKVLPGGIGVISSEEKDGFSIMKSLFGDYDGDDLVYHPAISNKSIEDVAEMAHGNEGRSVVYREAMREKAIATDLLKGRNQSGFFEQSLAERRAVLAEAKNLEKSEIGSISNRLEEIHRVNRETSLMAKGGDFRKGINAANTLQILAENSIKGKKQTAEELHSGKTMEMMRAFTNENEDTAVRKAHVMNFLDDLMLGQIEDGAKRKVLADRLRKEVPSQELAEELKSSGIGHADKIFESGWFKNIASDETVDHLLQQSTLSKDYNKTTQAAIDFAADIKEQNGSRITKLAEKLEKPAFKALGNIGKYALLPAAALGLMGTLTNGGTQAPSGQKQYSDGQAKHQTNYIKKPVFSDTYMSRPRYDRVQITGGSNGRTNFSSFEDAGSSNVRLTDHTQNFDKHKIREEVERGR